MKKIKNLLFVITISVLAVSCSKDDPIVEENKIYNFKGTILDNENQPIENSLVKLDEKSILTDANGQFEFLNIETDNPQVIITAEKESFIKGYRTVADLQIENTIKLSLLKDKLATIIGTGGKSSTFFPTGLTFTVDGFISKLDGTAFSGFLYPVIHHISYKNEEALEIAPGFNKSENAQYGFAYVKLEDDENNKLDITDGYFATLNFLIDPIDVTSAPEEITIYNFNESSGLWVEYGNAVKVKIGTKWYFKAQISSFQKPWFKLEVKE
jgi:hypothetical protein